MKVGLPFKSVVSVAAASKDLTILATVKTELGISGSSQDTYIATLIEQASSFAVSYCNREFAKETVIDTFRLGCAVDQLLLSRPSLRTVTSIVEDGTTLAAADFESVGDKIGSYLYRLNGSDDRSRWSASKIVVTYECGWILLTELPHDVERACIELIKRRWFARERDPLVKGEVVPDVYEVQYWVNSSTESSGLPADIASILDQYRVTPLA